MLTKKKILIVNGTQFGHSSGHYFYCKYLLENYYISYICYDRGLNKIVLEGVDVHYVSFSGSKLDRILRFLKVSISQSIKINPNLLFVTYFDLCFLLAVFCHAKKSILDIRTGSLKKKSIRRSIDNYIILLQSLFFKGVIILSQSLRKKLNISDRKCIVVPLGSEIYFAGMHIFSTIHLLYVGALDDRNIAETIKGLHRFLQNSKGDAIEISYTIIGFGSEPETLKIVNCISDLKLSETVKFEGRKTHEELWPYFKKANYGIVFVPQTKGYDCQPVTKLFEYMLSGMPVIATNTYENRLIVNEKNGVLINDSAEAFCDGLMRVYNQRGSYDSSEIRKSVEKHTWETIVNTNLKPYLIKIL